MTANVDKDAYIYPKPRLEAAVHVGFLPSPQLETALRGFLLPQNQEDFYATGNRMGKIVLKSVAERRFGFDRSDNDGIRFIPIDKLALAQETVVFDDMREEPIHVADITLFEATNHDFVVAFPLGPTPEQRRRLGGVVLRDCLSATDAPLLVYKRFDHQLLPDADAVIHHAAMIHRTLTTHHQGGDGQLPNTTSPFYVNHPHHTGIQLRRPRPGV